MHRTDEFRLSQPDDPVALSQRRRRRVVQETLEALVAVGALVVAIGALIASR